VSDATITFAVLGAAVVLFVWNRLPVPVVALGVAMALYGAGVIDVNEAFAGFGDPTVVFIASLFVVSEALDATGVTTWAGQRLVAAAGEGGGGKLVVLLLLLAAGLSAVLTPNGAVAALLPLTVLIAVRTGRAPSRLLIPMAYSAYAGALLVLMGSPVNVLVAEEADRTTGDGFEFFTFALVGVPLVAGVVGLVVWLGPRLLPERRPRALPPDLSEHARTLVEDYTLVRHAVPDALFTRASGVAEVVVPPRSVLVGLDLVPGMATPSGDLVVLAVRRAGADLGPRDGPLREGDLLLLEGPWGALEHHLGGDEVLVVDAPGAVRRQVVPLGPGARRALVVVACMVVALAAGLMPAAVAGVLAAGALVLLRVVGVDQAFRSIEWTAVVLIAGLIPLSHALQTTGAADDLADLVLDIVGNAGPRVLLLVLGLVAAALSIAVSNTATALILIPVATSAAQALSISPRPVLMSLAVACSASFLTPISTPGNLMIMSPAGYRFGDYWRFGAPCTLLFLLIAIFWVPVVWRF
jgi:di/tricarboxylate transporter